MWTFSKKITSDTYCKHTHTHTHKILFTFQLVCLILLLRLRQEPTCVSSPFYFVLYLESPYKINKPNLTADHTFKHLDSRIPTITPISCSIDISRDSPKNTPNHPPNPYICNPAPITSVLYVSYFFSSTISLLPISYFSYSFYLHLFHFISISHILFISLYSHSTETRYLYGCLGFLECLLTSYVYEC